MTGNLATYLTRHLARPQHVLYRHCMDGGWRDVTVAEVAARAAQWQAAFRRDGFAAGERIAIAARNGVDWVAIDLAALGMGLVVVPQYVDDNAENVAWCVANAEARLLIVESARLGAQLQEATEHGQALPRVVVLRADGDGRGGADAYLAGAAPAAFEVIDVAESTLATICYTSGTSGRAKGVMLSHGNIRANVAQCAATNLARPDDRFLSILPLSHMFERTGGYYLPLSLGATVVYGRGIAQIADDLASERPTVIFAVPRIFEKFHVRIEATLADSPMKARLFAQCVAANVRRAAGLGSLVDAVAAPVLRRIVGRPILARMGGRLRLAVVGGAALDPALARTFGALGLPLLQGYGMTEASPVVAVNRLEANVPESVGPPLPGIEVKIADTGELLVRGPNVMQGYWRNAAATEAAVDAQGWLHTGDLALLRDGSIVIRGRAKEIFVMSTGEKLPPQDVELAILRDPVFDQAMLVGDGRPYVVLLAVSKEGDPGTLVKRANAQLGSLPRWTRVRRVISSPEPWTVENGLLTPTLKLKRAKLLERFAPQIDAAYREPPAG